MGLIPRILAPKTPEGGYISLVHTIQTVAGTTSLSLFGQGPSASRKGRAPDNLRVTTAWVVMTGAGAGGDTVQLTNQSGNAITEALDVSAFIDGRQAHFQNVNDAYTDITKWSGDIFVVTASDALCRVYVEFQKL